MSTIHKDILNLIEEIENYGNPIATSPVIHPALSSSPPQRPGSGLLKKALIGTGVGLTGLGLLGYAANTGMIPNPVAASPVSPLPRLTFV